MADIFIRIPAKLKDLVEPLQTLIQGVSDRIAGFGTDGGRIDYREVEREMGILAANIERQAHGAMLSSLDVDGRSVRVWGKEYRRVGKSRGAYHTLAGTVHVEHTLYRPRGSNKKTISAVASRIGAVDGSWLPQTATAMAHQLTQVTSREAADAAVQIGRLQYSRSSFERVAHAVGRDYVSREVQILGKEVEDNSLPENATSLSMSIDRVCVPMEEPIENALEDNVWAALQPQKRCVIDETLEALEKVFLNRDIQQMVNQDGPKISRVYRQAYCGTLTLHDSAGEALKTYRFGKLPDVSNLTGASATQLCNGMHVVATRLLERNPDLRVSFLADGAIELWNLFDAHLSNLGKTKPMQLVDFWHVSEYLGKAATFMRQHGDAGDNQLHLWKERLKTQDGSAAEILEELRATGLDKIGGEDNPVEAAIGYIEKRLDKMEYARARRENRPIGSGHVEAACKSLVAIRMKRPGSRWKLDSGDHIIKLRALSLSDCWEGGMQKTLRRLAKPVKIASPISFAMAA